MQRLFFLICRSMSRGSRRVCSCIVSTEYTHIYIFLKTFFFLTFLSPVFLVTSTFSPSLSEHAHKRVHWRLGSRAWCLAVARWHQRLRPAWPEGWPRGASHTASFLHISHDVNAACLLSVVLVVCVDAVVPQMMWMLRVHLCTSFSWSLSFLSPLSLNALYSF